MTQPMSPENDAAGHALPHGVLSRRRLLQCAGLGLLAAGAPRVARAAAEAPIVQLRSGRVRGVRDGASFVFKGIPYGADTATSRFAPPQREPAWRGIREATQSGLACPQLNASEPTGEDCLSLNVWTPGLGDRAKRPILVYIHGGAFSTGSGSDPLYDGRRLSRRGDVVVVTVNHRLNAFGYLFLAQLGDAGLAQSGNAGQLDLIAALHWVREHAEAFGGDAGNVTVFGQSGGGAKIATLMAMPAARGLFHRAWTMSGQQVTAAGPRAATQRAQRYLEALGVGPDQLARVKQLPSAALVGALRVRDPSRVEDTALYLGPVLDGQALPRHPFWPDAPPQGAQIPMVVGNTRDETRAFLGNDARHFTLDWDALPALLERQQFVDLPTKGVIDEYRRLYPRYTPSEVFFAATTAGRSWRGAVETLEARARQGAPTWAYQLDWYDRDGPHASRRAFHTLDIPLVFDNVGQPGAATGDGPGARAMAAAMADALLAFARHGDPRHPGLADWSPYTLERRQTMVFDDASRLEDDPRGGERRLYAQAPFLQRGTQ
ncbi:carboxylesterase/lipase family protein [Pseudoxanthomonas composti]|uniref:Carboxylic ester hydrolase n=2 Tax=Pseudoxanthomonas composti TaxID=2137479 RepID=A0A4Q1JVN6_9GAMM|nr:carboxylesterase/lipase family protein [Pseudoxanthomonas composti]